MIRYFVPRFRSNPNLFLIEDLRKTWNSHLWERRSWRSGFL